MRILYFLILLFSYPAFPGVTIDIHQAKTEQIKSTKQPTDGEPTKSVKVELSFTATNDVAGGLYMTLGYSVICPGSTNKYGLVSKQKYDSNIALHKVTGTEHINEFDKWNAGNHGCNIAYRTEAIGVERLLSWSVQGLFHLIAIVFTVSETPGPTSLGRDNNHPFTMIRPPRGQVASCQITGDPK
ncbi:MAG: hypothetical protein ACI8WB_001846 [Phenylobacterium sp.]|jgi:hypothetical protein